MKRLVAFFAERSLIVNIISVGVILAGLVFLMTANREAFPKIEYDWVVITTIYPGATARDIEKHITIPIEDQLREVDDIKQVSSGSSESRSVIGVQIDPDAENKDKTVNDIKNAVDMVTDLPEDAEDPIVTELSTNLVPVLEISILDKDGLSDDEDERELRAKAKLLEDRILELDGIARVDKQGYRDREMIVEANPRLLDEYHIGLNQIIMALSKKNLNFPGGLINTKDGEVMIRTIGEVETVRDIENVFIRTTDFGYDVKVGDVARVRDSFDEREIINKAMGYDAITLTIMKKESADIIDVVESVASEIEVFKKANLNEEHDIKLSNDLSYYVKRRLNVLVNNGMVGLILVFLSLFISLGWRISLVTAIGVPIAMCGTFVWMGQAGVTVNLMSMFGMIMVLGMLVDDAIIVAENVYRHMEMGKPVKEAVIDGTAEVITPVLGTILTTVAAFGPLMFMSGIMGKFMWTLPAVVSVSLIFSWFESMFILPAHILDIEKMRRKPGQEVHRKEPGLFEKMKDLYTRILVQVLKHKYKVSAGIAVVFFFSLMMIATGTVKFVLFPQGGIERFVIKAEAETGTTLEEMNSKIANVEKILLALPEGELEDFITQAGIVREEPMDPETKHGSNYGVVIVNLTPDQTRERKANEIVKDVRQKAKDQGFMDDFVKLEIVMSQGGPPQGKPVNVTIKGDDFELMQKISGMYKEYLHKIADEYSYIDRETGKKVPGLKDIKDDFEEGRLEKRIFIDEKKASYAGISVLDVATTVRTCFTGTVATEIKKTDEEIDIRVIFPEEYQDSLASLNMIKIANMMGNLIPLSEIASFDETRGISEIDRRDWKRAIQVTADIDENAKKVTSVTVNRMLQEKFTGIQDKYRGVIVSYEGEFEDTQESIDNMVRSYAIAFIIIYIILVALFRTLHHPFVIISVLPLTFIGVIWIFFFHGLPLSFLALMGVVGLAGVVVNDSIVLVDFIKNARMRGLSPYDASIEAGGNRLRPVFLTTVTTFFGLIPTAYGFGGKDPFLVPMAVSLGWGLAFGSFVTLFATPIMYNIFADIRKLLTGKTQAPGYTEKQHDLYEIRKEQEFEEIKDYIEEDLRERIRHEIEEELTKTKEEDRDAKKEKPVKKRKKKK